MRVSFDASGEVVVITGGAQGIGAALAAAVNAAGGTAVVFDVVKPADAALSSTPAMLLSGAANLRDGFTLSPAGSREGLDWVLVEPRKPEADFRRALFGFSKGELRRMIIDDRLGQTATIELASVERNAKVDPQEVSFTPPNGADVIGTPAK